MSTLAVHLEQLDAWLASLPGAPHWAGHLIAERGYVAPGEDGRQILIAPEPPRLATDYAPRFAELLRAGYAWINLNGAGVAHGRLLVGVEVPQATGLPAGSTRVNLSGPTPPVRERDGWAIDFEARGR